MPMAIAPAIEYEGVEGSRRKWARVSRSVAARPLPSTGGAGRMADDEVRPGAQGGGQPLADEIMKALDDQVPPKSPSWWQYQLVVGELGADVVRQLVTEVRAVEARGGLKTLDGSRQRTTGGIFF